MNGANSETYAIQHLFLDKKKTYTDILGPTDKDCNKINSKHIRMKHVPAPCLKYYAEQNNISVLGMYKQLFDNKKISSLI